MENLVEFLLLHLPIYTDTFLAFLAVFSLWSIEKDLQILVNRKSVVEDEVQKLTNTVMGSMNDMRKIVNNRQSRNRDQK